MNGMAASFGLLESASCAVSLTDAILSSVSDGVLGIDCAGVIKFASESAMRMIGGEPRNLVGQSIHELLDGPGTEDVGSRWREACRAQNCAVCRSLAEGEQHRVESAEFTLSDGGRLTVAYTVTPVRAEQKIVGVILGFADVTPRRRVEAESLQQRKLKEIGRLAAGVAHEINTPTQYVNDNIHFVSDAVVTVMNLLRECSRTVSLTGQPTNRVMTDLAGQLAAADLETLGREISAAIEQALEGLGRINGIVGALNDFLHPGTDEMTSVDLNRLIENAVAVCRNEWRYVAEMEWNLCDDLPPVPCYRGDFSRAMVNIVRNAAQAIAAALDGDGAPRGRITVSTRRVGDWVEVRVSDTGVGIAPELQERIFDSFFTTKPVGRGTGQGLAIVRSVVVEQHGGELAVESNVGKGATFVVQLPLDGTSERKSAPTESTNEGTRQDGPITVC
jgi:PAS domain S-box-containing protein